MTMIPDPPAPPLLGSIPAPPPPPPVFAHPAPACLGLGEGVPKPP